MTPKHDAKLFQKWIDFYEEKFARITDSQLKGYWYCYGRASEQESTVQEDAAYICVNQACDERGIWR